METTIQDQNHSPNYGLLRFRSAPSSLFANLTEGVVSGPNKGSPGEGSESRRVISRFVDYAVNSDSDSSAIMQEFEDKTQMTVATRAAAANQINSQHVQSGLPPYYPRQSGATSSSAMDSSYGLFGSSLSRQNSSPAGFFSHISAQNDYFAMRGVESYSGINGSEEDLFPSSNGLKTQINFAPRPPSRLGILPDISEIGDDAIAGAAKKLENNNGDAHFQGPGFHYGSLIESSPPFGENFIGIIPDRPHDGKLFSNTQSEKLRNGTLSISHQSSMPQTSSELLAIEKFLQIQDSVPCRVRAKRGCATHPRSIAERERRTRISERMRKLQDLVPNMDKQTNTADMLDLAAVYIKDLQNQFKILGTKRANCKCSGLNKSLKDPTF